MLTTSAQALSGLGKAPFGDRVRYTLKAALAAALYKSGALQAFQRRALRQRAVVLMYHRVLSPDERQSAASHPGIVVNRRTFAMQMALLRRHFNVLSAQKFAWHLDTRTPFPDSACLITFDDGWRDTFENARPILQYHGLPALVFLPVNFIGTERVFWQEALTHLLEHARTQTRASLAAQGALETLLGRWNLADALALAGLDVRSRISEMVGRLKAAPREEVDELIEELCIRLRLDPVRFSVSDGFMNWQQADEMTRGGVSFGGHGAEHYLLTSVPMEAAEGEFRAARVAMAERLTSPMPAFSYPNGSWAPEVAAMARREGYTLAFTTDPGFVSCTDDALALRRINIHEDTTNTPALFFARVTGLF